MILQATLLFPTVQTQVSLIPEVKLDRTLVPNRDALLPGRTRTARRMAPWDRAATDSRQSTPDTSPRFAEE